MKNPQALMNEALKKVFNTGTKIRADQVGVGELVLMENQRLGSNYITGMRVKHSALPKAVAFHFTSVNGISALAGVPGATPVVRLFAVPQLDYVDLGPEVEDSNEPTVIDNSERLPQRLYGVLRTFILGRSTYVTASEHKLLTERSLGLVFRLCSFGGRKSVTRPWEIDSRSPSVSRRLVSELLAKHDETKAKPRVTQLTPATFEKAFPIASVRHRVIVLLRDLLTSWSRVTQTTATQLESLNFGLVLEPQTPIESEHWIRSVKKLNAAAARTVMTFLADYTGINESIQRDTVNGLDLSWLLRVVAGAPSNVHMILSKDEAAKVGELLGVTLDKSNTTVRLAGSAMMLLRHALKAQGLGLINLQALSTSSEALMCELIDNDYVGPIHSSATYRVKELTKLDVGVASKHEPGKGTFVFIGDGGTRRVRRAVQLLDVMNAPKPINSVKAKK